MVFEKSKSFFEDFTGIFATDSPVREEAVKAYNNAKKFTDFIIPQINKIISQKYCTQNEYFRIDAMGYTSRYQELPKYTRLESQLWDMDIAVEHENAHKKWLDEVVKLAHICCPLRVVIGYVPRNLRENDGEYLEYAASALSQLKYCKSNLMQGEFMVILGNSNIGTDVDSYFNYKAYVLHYNSLADTFEFKKL